MGTKWSTVRDVAQLFVPFGSLVPLSDNRCGLKRSMQHHLDITLFSKVVFMIQGKRFGLSAAQKGDMWRRWKAGQSLDGFLARSPLSTSNSTLCLCSR
jgi:hypothetical protein